MAVKPIGALRRHVVAVVVVAAALQRVGVVADRRDDFDDAGVVGLELDERAGDGSLAGRREDGAEAGGIDLVAETVAAVVEGVVRTARCRTGSCC